MGHGRERQFHIESEPLDVTSLHRPDPAWHFTDPSGHEHRWHVNGQPASGYRPSDRYEIPTTRVVQDEPYTDEYGDEVHPSHLECLQCRATVNPGYTADTTRQYVAGLQRCFVDGVEVSREEFERLVKEESSRS